MPPTMFSLIVALLATSAAATPVELAPRQNAAREIHPYTQWTKCLGAASAVDGGLVTM